jgi:hypothetical protein
MKKKRFELEQKDITCGWVGARTGARRKLARAPASVDLSSSQLFLKHIPTGIEVGGEIPPGHYNNKEMRNAKERLQAELQERLRVAVAQHLRIRGQ